MARHLNGTSDHLASTSAIDLSGVTKLTVAIWVYVDSYASPGSGDATILSLGAVNTAGSFRIVANNNHDKWSILTYQGGGAGFSQLDYFHPSAGAWHLYLVHLDTSADYQVAGAWLDNVAQTPAILTGLDPFSSAYGNATLHIGSVGGTSSFLNGSVAFGAIWAGHLLNSSDRTAVWTGLPTDASVAPDYYWTIAGSASPEPATDGGINLTVTGTTQTDGPELVQPLITLPYSLVHNASDAAVTISWFRTRPAMSSTLFSLSTDHGGISPSTVTLGTSGGATATATLTAPSSSSGSGTITAHHSGMPDGTAPFTYAPALVKVSAVEIAPSGNLCRVHVTTDPGGSPQAITAAATGGTITVNGGSPVALTDPMYDGLQAAVLFPINFGYAAAVDDPAATLSGTWGSAPLDSSIVVGGSFSFSGDPAALATYAWTDVPPGNYAVSALIPNRITGANALAHYVVKDGATTLTTVDIDQAVIGNFGDDPTVSFSRVYHLHRYTDLDTVTIADGTTVTVDVTNIKSPLVHKATSFQGTSDHADSASNVNLSGYSRLTLTFWMNHGTYHDGANRILVWHPSFIVMPDNSGNVIAFFVTKGAATGGLGGSRTPFSASNWHHVAVLMDTADAHGVTAVYVDGNPYTLDADLGTSPTGGNFGSGSFYLGGAGASAFDEAILYDVAIWGRHLSTGELSTVRNGKPSDVGSGLAYYWPLGSSGATEAATTGGVSLTKTGTTQVSAPDDGSVGNLIIDALLLTRLQDPPICSEGDTVAWQFPDRAFNTAIDYTGQISGTTTVPSLSSRLATWFPFDAGADRTMKLAYNLGPYQWDVPGHPFANRVRTSFGWGWSAGSWTLDPVTKQLTSGGGAGATAGITIQDNFGRNGMDGWGFPTHLTPGWGQPDDTPGTWRVKFVGHGTNPTVVLQAGNGALCTVDSGSNSGVGPQEFTTTVHYPLLDSQTYAPSISITLIDGGSGTDYITDLEVYGPEIPLDWDLTVHPAHYDRLHDRGFVATRHLTTMPVTFTGGNNAAEYADLPQDGVTSCGIDLKTVSAAIASAEPVDLTGADADDAQKYFFYENGKAAVKLVLTPPDGLTGATATAHISGGHVTSITVDSGGAGYPWTPNVRLHSAVGHGYGAEALATVSGGVITGIAVTNPGSGYDTAPTVLIAQHPFSPGQCYQVTSGTTHYADTSDGNGTTTGIDIYCPEGTINAIELCPSETEVLAYVNRNSSPAGPALITLAGSETPTASVIVKFSSGFPAAWIAEMANDTGVAPWVNLPDTLSDDGWVKFWTELSPLLNPGIKAYTENSNEHWNFLFKQWWHYRALAHYQAAYGLAGDGPDVSYGRESARKYALARAAWVGAGRPAEDLIRVAGGFLIVPSWNAAMIAAGGADAFDAIAMADYIAPERNAANIEWADGLDMDTAFDRLEPGSLLEVAAYDFLGPEHTGWNAPVIAANNAAATDAGYTYPLQYIHYEGGFQQLCHYGDSNQQTARSHAAAKHPFAYHAELALLQCFEDHGVTLHCRFLLDGTSLAEGGSAWADYHADSMLVGTGNLAENPQPWDMRRAVSQFGGAMRTWAALTMGPTPTPTVTTDEADTITNTTATLHGTVNPNGASTTAEFLYGTSPTLAGGTTTTPQSIGAGSSDVPVSQSISGLAAATTYYHRATATSAGGTVNGSILNFTTTGSPTPTPTPTSTPQRDRLHPQRSKPIPLKRRMDLINLAAQPGPTIVSMAQPSVSSFDPGSSAPAAAPNAPINSRPVRRGRTTPDFPAPPARG
jgi:hypothetical protein